MDTLKNIIAYTWLLVLLAIIGYVIGMLITMLGYGMSNIIQHLSTYKLADVCNFLLSVGCTIGIMILFAILSAWSLSHVFSNSGK